MFSSSRLVVSLLAMSAVLVTQLIASSVSSGADGEIDTSFSRDGVALGDSIAANGQLSRYFSSQVDAQSDGGVVAVVKRQLRRYTRSGDVDHSFGEKGTADFSSVGSVRQVVGLEVDGADRIVAALGVETNSEDGDVLLIRLTADGALDPTFATNGVFDTAVGIFGSEPDLFGPGVGPAGSLDVDSAGGVVYGTVGKLLRLTPAGRLDEAFAQDGQIETGDRSIFGPTVLRPDGAVLTGFAGALTQFSSDGTTDVLFGNGGTTALRATDLALAPDGSAYVQTTYCSPFIVTLDECTAALTKVKADGTLDEAFEPPARRGGPVPSDLAVDSKGRLLLADYLGRDQAFHLTLGVSRLVPDGGLDPAFGRRGTSQTYPAGCRGTPHDLAVDSLGRTLVGGSICDKYGVLRLRSHPGPSDVDGDGAANRRDPCKEFPGRHRGCPFIGTTARLLGSKDGSLAGLLRVSSNGIPTQVAESCIHGRSVTVLREHRGTDKRIASGSTNNRGMWPLQLNVKPGRYYIRARPIFSHRGIRSAYCPGVESAIRAIQ